MKNFKKILFTGILAIHISSFLQIKTSDNNSSKPIKHHLETNNHVSYDDELYEDNMIRVNPYCCGTILFAAILKYFGF